MRWVDITNDAARPKIEGFPYRFFSIIFESGEDYDIRSINAFINDAQEWCKREFTDDRDRWIWKGSSFNFRDREDAFMFKVRWC